MARWAGIICKSGLKLKDFKITFRCILVFMIHTVYGFVKEQPQFMRLKQARQHTASNQY